MGTRQYIGARYVPKFYVNADDGSSLWENNVIYEPLTWVTRPNFRMYLSRQTVPATVGAPEDNIQYWLEVGNFNGYIRDLQNQIDSIVNSLNGYGDRISAVEGEISEIDGRFDTVEGNITALSSRVRTVENEITQIDSRFDTVEGNITTLSNRVGTVELNITALQNEINNVNNFKFWHGKKVVVYGDSLSANPNGYWKKLTDRDSSIRLTNRSVSGSTIDSAATAIGSASDLASFDIAVIAFGTNEWQNMWWEDKIKSEFRNCFDALKVKIASNADSQVVVITPPYSYRDFGGINTEANLVGLTLEDTNDIIAEVAKEYGYPVLNFYDCSSCNHSNYTYRLDNDSGIYVHPKGDFITELSYIVERWDGTGYHGKPYIMGKNILNIVEFANYSWRVTQNHFVNVIPAKYQNGICMLLPAGANAHTAFKRALSADCEYNLRLWSSVDLGIVITDGTNVVYQITAGGYGREFRARINIPEDGYYHIYFNTSAECLVGGLCMSRADGVEQENLWNTCSLTGATSGNVAYKLNGDEITLNTTQITVPANTLPEITLLGMPNLPSGQAMIIETAGSMSSPELVPAVFDGNKLKYQRSFSSQTYYQVYSSPIKVKCYNFSFQTS